MKSHFLIPIFAFALAPSATTLAQSITRFPSQHASGTARAVKVEDLPLVFTGEVFGRDDQGRIHGDARAQATRALAQLSRLLAESGSNFYQVARLNVQISLDENAAAVNDAVAAAFARAPVSVTYARTALRVDGALVAISAMAVAPNAALTDVRLTPNVATMPPGRRIFISGQAQSAKTLAEGTKLTMASLGRSLEHLKRRKSDVALVKAFLTPFADHSELTREIESFFSPDRAPPIITVQWESQTPTEIELVAYGGRGGEPVPALAFEPLPDLPNTPRFSRSCIVASGVPLIFTSGLYGKAGLTPAEQMRDILAQLGDILLETGGSFSSLVKGTYSWSSDSARQSLNDLRRVYFNPARAPAASGVAVQGVGQPGRHASLEMIAAPAEK